MKYFDIAIIISASVLAFVVLVCFIKSKNPFRNLLSSSCLGLSAFAFINLVSNITGFSLCLTPLSLAFCSFLGLPGVLCLVLIKIIWKI